MKKLFSLFLLIIITVGLSAQTVTYQDIVNQKSAKELTGRTGGGDISVYVASNGVTYTKGSTITYGYPTNGKYYVYFKDVTGSVFGTLAEDESSNASTSAANREVYERVENRAGGVATIKRIQCVPVDPFNRKTCGCKSIWFLTAVDWPVPISKRHWPPTRLSPRPTPPIPLPKPPLRN